VIIPVRVLEGALGTVRLRDAKLLIAQGLPEFFGGGLLETGTIPRHGLFPPEGEWLF
jgi:hypothetical protein